MATTIEIHIRGLAFCYYEEATKLWKVIFLCEKENTQHELLFSYSGSRRPREPLFMKKKIEFAVKDAEDLDSPKGEDFEIIYNIVKDAHKKNGVVWKQTPSQKFNFIEMSIPCAELYCEDETNRKYIIVEKKGNQTGEPMELRKVADTVGARIRLQNTGSLSLKIDGVDKPLGFDYSKDGATYKLMFDNNCDTPYPFCGDPYDSLEYYDLIEDAKEKDLQYIATRGSRDRKSERLILSPEGNCDPVASDPPPGGGNR